MTLVELDVYNREARKRTQALGALVFYLQIEISTFYSKTMTNFLVSLLLFYYRNCQYFLEKYLTYLTDRADRKIFLSGLFDNTANRLEISCHSHGKKTRQKLNNRTYR